MEFTSPFMLRLRKIITKFYLNILFIHIVCIFLQINSKKLQKKVAMDRKN